MDPALFENLLREEESVVLDFKRDQYRFSKATNDEKSELLKDILGFANAWRRADAYILIGVEDVRGGRGNVVGISEQLPDHSVQQFVSGRTNRPIQFHYEAFNYHLFRPVRLLVENAGSTLASEVRLELDIVSAAGVSVKGHEPSMPRRKNSFPDINADMFQNIRPVHRTPGDVEIVKSKDGARLEVECHNMQPGRRVWSDKFYVAVRTNGTTVIPGRIFAATLPQPREFSLVIEATVQEAFVSVDDLRRSAQKLRG
jgi:hypothetical protein